MTGFDTIVMVDWASGKDTGPRPRKDAIWACRAGEDPVYLRNRDVTLRWLGDLIGSEVAAGRRVLAGFDFPFGYPAGFAERVCGRPDPLALWDWLSGELHDSPQGNTRFALAGRINGLFPGVGPFWFNGGRADVPDLPRKGRARTPTGLPERRLAETRASGTFTCWQMGGAGSVGGQAMTGMAALARLRRRFGAALTVWPFQSATGAVVLAEVWPSLIAQAVAEGQRPGEIRDAAQVRILAQTLWQAQIAGALAAMLDDVPAIAQQEEGWILGLGHEAALRSFSRAGRSDA